MTTPEMIRCKDCAYLAEREDGVWICTDSYYDGDCKPIDEIPISEPCSLDIEC